MTGLGVAVDTALNIYVGVFVKPHHHVHTDPVENILCKIGWTHATTLGPALGGNEILSLLYRIESDLLFAQMPGNLERSQTYPQVGVLVGAVTLTYRVPFSDRS